MSVRCTEHRRKTHAVQASPYEGIQRTAKGEILRCHSYPSRHLHPPLPRQQRLYVLHDAVKAATPVFVHAQAIVDLLRTIETYRKRESELFKEIPVRRCEESAVGGDRERQRKSAALGQLSSASRGRLKHGAVDEPL